MPLPLPLQQQHNSSPVVPPEHQQQQLALAQQQATTPAFAPQASAPDPGLHLHHHRNSAHNHSQHPVAAAYTQRRDRSQQSSMAYQPSDEEMAEMQRLSAAYESESTVCIVVARVTARFLHLAASECNPRTISDAARPMNLTLTVVCCRDLWWANVSRALQLRTSMPPQTQPIRPRLQ
jgi:hypothetical protein